MNASKFFAVAALSAVAAFTSAAYAAPVNHVITGEVGVAVEAPAMSTVDRATVRAQAVQAVREGQIQSGEASVVRGTEHAGSGVDRAAVRAQTVDAVRSGTISRGEA